MLLQYIVFLLLCVVTINGKEEFTEVSKVYKYISRGSDAAEGQFPYQVGLIHVERLHFCGASIISEHYVLSAAHCFYQRPTNNPSMVKVAVGSIYINSGVMYDVRVIKLYPGYRVQNRNDVAVLNTFDTIWFNTYVQPIVLAYRRIGDGECIVSGWGLLGEQGSSSKPQVLQYSVERAITIGQCRTVWPDVDASNICTGREGNKGTRPGDSGGPLVIQTNDGYRQVGIVSRSAPGCPYIFTSVPFVLDWISYATNNFS